MSEPLGLYLHWPWCVRKCPYCDFNSHPLRADSDPYGAYTDALLRDLAEEAPRAAGRRITSIFIGGGTPSLVPPRYMARVLDAIREQLGVVRGAEITLEANPGTVDEGHFAGYRDAGVNRLSIGAQSFDDELLKRLGRIHHGDAIAEAVATARRAGFDNLNIDLMYALPGQTLAGARRDVELALALEPEHVSYYQLTIEPGTAFGQHPPQLPDDDDAWAIEAQGHALLRAAGFRRYEISAFARPGRRSRHNLNYWRFGDYLGIGAGAHGKLTLDGSVVRRAKMRSPERYIRGAGTAAGIASEHRPTAEQLISEYALNTLRIGGAFDTADFTRRTGVAAAALAPALRSAQNLGLIEIAGTRVRRTPRGVRHLNRLLECFA